MSYRIFIPSHSDNERHCHLFFFFRSKQVVHLETRIQFDLGSDEIKSGNHAAVKGDGTAGVTGGAAEPGGKECLLTSGEMATCMDFIACQKYTGIRLSDKLGMLLHRNDLSMACYSF